MSSPRSSDSRPPTEPTVEPLILALKGVVAAMRSWTEEDLKAFLAGELDLTIRLPSKSAKRRRVSPASMKHAADDVRLAFGTMETREQGLAYLDDMGFGREALRALVAALDLPANRADNMERLRNRIVEALIGYRLRSRAIRGDEQRSPSGEPSPD